MIAFLALAALVFVLLVVRQARAERELARKTGPGTAPGEGDLIVEGAWLSGGPGGGHFSYARVTRDPIEYVRKASPRSSMKPYFSRQAQGKAIEPRQERTAKTAQAAPNKERTDG